VVPELLKDLGQAKPGPIETRTKPAEVVEPKGKSK
jgi:hypothetical protein